MCCAEHLTFSLNTGLTFDNIVATLLFVKAKVQPLQMGQLLV